MDEPVNHLCDSCWEEQKRNSVRVTCNHPNTSPIYPTPEHPEGGYRVKGKPTGNILRALQQIFLSDGKGTMAEDKDTVIFYRGEEVHFGFEPLFEPMKEKDSDNDGDAGS